MDLNQNLNQEARELYKSEIENSESMPDIKKYEVLQDHNKLSVQAHYFEIGSSRDNDCLCFYSFGNDCDPELVASFAYWDHVIEIS